MKLKDFPAIEKLITHIFGNQTLLALDYLQLVQEKPEQRLPPLHLYGPRMCGKSTFIQFLIQLFAGKIVGISGIAAVNTLETIAHKRIIFTEEIPANEYVFWQRVKEVTEAGYIGVNKKGYDYKEIPFYGKFVTTSNDTEFPLTDSWIVKVPPLENYQLDLFDQIRIEVPAFSYFLSRRKLDSKEQSRYWFHPGVLLHAPKPKKILLPAEHTAVIIPTNKLPKLVNALSDATIFSGINYDEIYEKAITETN